MKRFIAALLAIVCAISIGAQTNEAAPLTLEQALAMAERLHPELAEARSLADASEGRVQQAGAFPNPSAVAGIESAPLKGRTLGEAEYVAGVSQALPLGGRISKAGQAEMIERERRRRQVEAKRVEIRKRVHSAFATALYQEKAFQTQREIFGTFEQSSAATRARVEAGDAVPQELARVEMETARAMVELKRSEALRTNAMISLASEIGDASFSVPSLQGNLDEIFEIPTMEIMIANLTNHPAAALAGADIRAQDARIALAKAERIPDVQVELLYRRLEAERRDGFDVIVSIPLPLFDRKKGRLQEARAELAAAEARARATQNQLNRTFHDAYSRLTSALSTSRSLKMEILPLADSILKSSEARLEVGDISVGDVLPVRRDWAAVQMSYVESLRDVMEAWAELTPFLGDSAHAAK